MITLCNDKLKVLFVFKAIKINPGVNFVILSISCRYSHYCMHIHQRKHK